MVKCNLFLGGRKNTVYPHSILIGIKTSKFKGRKKNYELKVRIEKKVLPSKEFYHLKLKLNNIILET